MGRGRGGPLAAAIEALAGGAVMFRFDAQLKVYEHHEAVDFRKSINGLAVLVEQALGLDPFAPALYVFANRRRNRVNH